MSKLFGIFGSDDEDRNIDRDADKKGTETGKLELRKEELDINKKRIPSGEVELSKEIIEEEQTVDVPVTHEEVVIERRSLNNKTTDSPISDTETIRIPVSEDQVDVSKHTVVTGEVRAHKRDVEETKHIDETLKREEAHISKTGNANIVSKSDKDFE
jgi:uncharacterized protein (TIGR02271 family)